MSLERISTLVAARKALLSELRRPVGIEVACERCQLALSRPPLLFRRGYRSGLITARALLADLIRQEHECCRKAQHNCVYDFDANGVARCVKCRSPR